MDSTVIVAVVSGCFTLLGSFVGVMASHSLTRYRLEQLEEKVDRHNKIIERTYALERRAEVNEEKMRVANHRIDDLEQEAKHE